MAEILIRNKTGEEFAIELHDFKTGRHVQDPKDVVPADSDNAKYISYEAAGYTPVHWHPSGVPYEAGKTEKQTLAAAITAAEAAPAPVVADVIPPPKVDEAKG